MMLYDIKPNSNRVVSSNFTCAFNIFRAGMQSHAIKDRTEWTGKSMDAQLWDALCEVLTASERRSILTPVTDLEPEWRDMLFACPYVDIVAQNTSKHGNYQAYICVVHKHKRPEAK